VKSIPSRDPTYRSFACPHATAAFAAAGSAVIDAPFETPRGLGATTTKTRIDGGWQRR
jgi:hypothetical protein